MTAAATAATDPRSGGGEPASGPPTVPVVVWWGVLAAASAVTVLLARGSYFFADDYLFLEQARTTPFGWTYLSIDLFGHFSPVTRLANKVLLQFGPGSWSVAWAVMVATFLVLVVSLQFLARVLHGRTVIGLTTAVVMVQSLGLVRILQWWTATVNLVPGIIGMVVGLAAYVRFRERGRVGWAVLCLGAYVLAVLSYELIMILPWYLLLAELLLVPARLPRRRRSRAGAPAGRARRAWRPATSVLWVLLVLVGAAAAVNYRVNYYQQTPRPGPGDALEALGIALGHTLAPGTLGLFRFGSVPPALVVLAAVVWVALVAWTLRTRSAWRGWAFAALGVAPPVLAVVVSRVGLYGVGVGRELYYAAIPMVALVVGAGEAVARRLEDLPRTSVAVRRRGVVAGAAYAAFLLAFVLSGIGIRDAEGYAATSRTYTDRVVRGLDRATRDGVASVLDRDVPARIVPTPMQPFNRASRVIALYRPGFRFDQGGGPLLVIGPDGDLRPAGETVRWSWRPGRDTPPTAVAGAAAGSSQGDRWCIDPAPDTRLRWDLPAPVSGTGLVVSMSGSTTRETGYGWLVDDGREIGSASYDPHVWSVERTGALETVRQERVVALELTGLRPGSTVCLDEVAVLQVPQG